MDNISVISLSSTSSRTSPVEEIPNSITTISSATETQRVPVSWENGRKSKTKIANFETPNHSQKVKDWICSCKCGDMGEHSSIEIYDSDDSKGDGMVCIRYDFEKRSSTRVEPQSRYAESTPLFSYMEKAKRNNLLNNNTRNVQSQNAQTPEKHKLNGYNSRNDNLASSHNYDTPLSPESQKKEFYSYLQLMKPTEKNHDIVREKRRSTRVKISEKETREEACKNKMYSDFEEFEKAIANVVNYPTLKSIEELNMKIDNFQNLFKNKNEQTNKYLPLPPKKIYEMETDFEDCVLSTVNDMKKNKQVYKKKQVQKKIKYGMNRHLKNITMNSRRKRSLQRKKRLEDVSLNCIALMKSRLKQKLSEAKAQIEEETAKKDESSLKGEIFHERNEDIYVLEEEIGKKDNKTDPRCEIITIHTYPDDENVDLKNFVDDMLELDKMSEEHRKSVIESRILTSSSITNLINKMSNQEGDVQRAYKIFSEISSERKCLEEKENNIQESMLSNSTQECTLANNSQESTLNAPEAILENNAEEPAVDVITSEHDYADPNLEDEKSPEDEDMMPGPILNVKALPVNRSTVKKSLHASLTFRTQKKVHTNIQELTNWSSNSNKDGKKLNHCIYISKQNGEILTAYYQEYNLIVVQERLVSFWMQSALGNILGAQNMWVPKGQAERLFLNGTYIQKRAAEIVISTDACVAYIELWMKEHKSHIREGPLADVFAMVYFWMPRQNGIEKKAIQLENIKGFLDDVQYVVLKYNPKIIVSWYSVQGDEKRTMIHSYQLASDFQTVASVSEIQAVKHYVSSLHNIEDCENLIAGYGEDKMTLWNVDYGYIVATVELTSIKPSLSTLWVKCDRGFLFVIQECMDQELRLIAINGLNLSWKKLQSYKPPAGFDNPKGVYIENGILITYYLQGILCWNAQTAELVVEEVPDDSEYIPSGKYLIMIVNEQIIVRHALSHFVTAEEI